MWVFANLGALEKLSFALQKQGLDVFLSVFYWPHAGCSENDVFLQRKGVR